MPQSSQDPNWLPWLGALAPIGLAVWGFIKRFFSCVTREELRESIMDSNRVIEIRHAEHLKRLDDQDDELKEIRSMVGKIEGQISGRYPQVKGP